jgi:peptidyl-prolyl cis-trans isomerase D
MLDFVRTHAKSWVVKVFLWVIVIVFVGWGGYAYQTRHEADVARVGEHYISGTEYQTAYNNMVEGVRKQFGGALPDDLMRSLDIKQRALDSLIQHYLILKGANALGLVATTDEVRRRILAIPAFQKDGKFDSKHYESLLLQMRMTPDVFEQEMSEDITSMNVESFIKGRAVVTEDEILTDYHLNRDQIKVAYLVLDPKSFEDKVTVAETDLRTFYQNNQDRYMEPEKREIAYVVLNMEDLEKEIHPSEDEIKRYYDENAAKFAREKQVRAQHILFRVKPDAPEAEVEKIRTEAQKVLDEAKKGKDFAELAKKYSQDEGSAKKGGELGFFSAKQMEPAFSAAAFALKPGEISDIVRTPYGFHVIKSEEITEARTAPLEEVRGDIERDIKSQGAQDIAYKQARNLRDLAYARKDLDKAAQEMKMTVSNPVWIDKLEDQPDSGPFPGAIKEKLFQLSQGDISDMLELPNGFAVAQVKSIKRPQPIPFENVKDKVAHDFRVEQAKGLAQKRAAEILAQAREKNNLADVAKEQNISLKQSEFFSRQDPDKELKQLRGAGLNSIFSLQNSNLFPESPLDLGNSFMVCQFQEKKAAGQPSEEQKAEISGRLIRQKQRAIWDSWLTGIRKTTKIEMLKEI